MPKPFPSGEGFQGHFHRHANYSTSKHALNSGERYDPVEKNTLARIFVAVPPNERTLFFDSIGDRHVQSKLAPAVTGTTRDATGDGVGKGYVDFFLEQVEHSVRENFQVAPTLEGNYVVYSFDQEPPIWPYSGVLINTKQDDQASNFFRLYVHIFRLAQLSKRKLVVALRYDSYIVHGAMVNLRLTHSSDVQMKVPFSFQLLVKKVIIVNYTINWNPTVPAGDFSDDPGSAGLDVLPVTRRRATTDVATTPINAELAPVPGHGADPRTEDEPLDPDSGSDEPLVLFTPPRASPATLAAAPATPEVVRPPVSR